MVCIPRGVCRAICGDESRGCVYSGTCQQQICFHDEYSGTAASLHLISHAGPGSVIQVVENSKPSEIKRIGGKRINVLPDTIISGFDVCLGPETKYPLSSSCSSTSASVALKSETAPTESDSQCRSLCRSFQDTQYEVVRRPTFCNICSESFFNKYKNSPAAYICIPLKTCRENCGEEGEGCVYSGTCASIFCFSGISSKKPATLKWDGEEGQNLIMEVDNSGDPKAFDPPLFTNVTTYQPILRNRQSMPIKSTSAPIPQPTSIPSSVPGDDVPSDGSIMISPTSIPPTHTTDTPTATPVPIPPPIVSNDVPTSSTRPTPSPSNPSNTDEDTGSKWIWLGPILGLLGAVLASAAALGAAYIMRGS